MEQFMTDVIKALKRKLGKEYKIFQKEQRKNNGLVLYGICIHKENEAVSPVVYPGELLLPYILGLLNTEKIADILLEQCRQGDIPQETIACLDDFNVMKEKIRIKVVNYDANKRNLGDCPHRKFLDLAVTYYLDLDMGETGQLASISVTNGLMETWGACEDALYQIGMDKLSAEDSCQVADLFTTVKKIALEEQDGKALEALARLEKKQDIPEMYMVSNQKCYFGASCLLNASCLQEMAEHKECDLIIVASHFS